MRDIRQDLRERLNEIMTQEQKLREQLVALQEQNEHLTAMLEKEQLRWPQNGPEPKPDAGSQQNPGELSDIIRELLRSGEPWNNWQLTQAALKRGYKFGERQPGRVLHFTLLGMFKGGEVVSLGLGKWKLKIPK